MGLISDRLARLAPSPTVAITDMAMNMRRAGRDIIGLGAGEPDFDTPQHIKDAAIAAMRAGKTKYTQVDGIPELKEAICRKFARENNIQSTPDMISVGTGGKQVLFNALMASLNPGDEVVIPVPYWVSFAGIVQLAEAVPVFLRPASPTLKFTPDELAACITAKTKWLILNSPSNPGGIGYTAADLTAIAEVLRQHPQVYVICDDIYEHLTYGDFTFATLVGVAPDLQSRVVTLNGVSKSYCMTGWRIGYCTAPPELVKAMAKVQSQSTSSPNSMAQWAAIAALDGPIDFIAENCRAFAARRQLVCDALNAMPGVSCAAPDGAFYVYPSISGLIGKKQPDGQVIETDADFVRYLLEAGEVAVVPGIAFGLSPYFRISYAASDEVLTEAMARISRVVDRLS
ncbi:MAG: pyridoxal phosphate-dependent aminotransferase [Alphaproteobacteria bacterium]|jgi:aspartate aminotransferase